MSAPILATKLHVPPPKPNAVLRARLVERLNTGLNRKLTLISAPAGFGKTTLVSEWAGGAELPAAWLSLDRGDNDPTRFLMYVVSALRTIEAGIGSEALGLLQSPQPRPAELILTSLINEIAGIPLDFFLVLDDYHMIDTETVDEALTFLLEHLPARMHLVIATRVDPDLPLARLRGRGQLTELRVKDLRFTSAEAAEFLNQAMGLNLSEDDIAALETRTEGWIAGLQLAALALQGLTLQGFAGQEQLSVQDRRDTAGFIESFTGSHRFIIDYLVDEVLQQQSESIREFLLSTSILDRLCGALCDAVLPQFPGSGQETLEYLERANLLVIPLDSRREWYRYHHLFAEVLQASLTAEHPDWLADLHLRASRWCEQNGYRPDAIHHALAADEFERAADLIEEERSEKSGTYYRSATWLGWLRALPDEVVRSRPRLSLGYAWELLFLGELEAAEARLQDTTQLLEPADPGDRSGGAGHVDDQVARQFRASLAVAQAFHAQSLGGLAGAEDYARRALALASEDDHVTHGLAGSLLAMACWTNGELEPADNHLADAIAHLRAAGYQLFAISGSFVQAEIRIAQGRLHDAANIYEEALELAAQSEPVMQGAADMHLGLSKINREWGEVEAARAHLDTAEVLGEQAALPEWPRDLYLVQAQVKVDHGDPDGAVELIEKADRLDIRSPVPSVHPIAAQKARVWIRQGKITEAEHWSRRQALSVDDDLSYLREFEHITLARLLIARRRSERGDGAIQKALGLLDRLLQAAEEGGRTGSAIEILALQALAHQEAGDSPTALELLERALTLGEPEGYVRVFVDEGAPMAALLARLVDVGLRAGAARVMSDTVARHAYRVLAALDEEGGIHPSTPDAQPLIEPLTPRELEVLQLIAQGLSNHEISERLYLAVSTVKGHNSSIFGKLQVQRRTEAVACARELGLLGPSP